MTYFPRSVLMVQRRSSETGSSSSIGYAGDIAPRETWESLARETAAQLIDVRTVAEWNFVGVPDLASLQRQAVLCEWQHFPPARTARSFKRSSRLSSRRATGRALRCSSSAAPVRVPEPRRLR